MGRNVIKTTAAANKSRSQSRRGVTDKMIEKRFGESRSSLIRAALAAHAEYIKSGGTELNIDDINAEVATQRGPSNRSETRDRRKKPMMSDSAFHELAREHDRHKERLSELSALAYPTDEEQLEEVTLKKKKLAIKDQMYSLMLQHEERRKSEH
jgi:uncharacterized protein YdcH (DUF465 family)